MAVVLDYDRAWPPSVENERTIVMAVSEKTAKVVAEEDSHQRHCVVKRWEMAVPGAPFSGMVLVSSGHRGAPASNNPGSGYTPPRRLLRELAEWLEKDADEDADWGDSATGRAKKEAANEINNRLDELSLLKEA